MKDNEKQLVKSVLEDFKTRQESRKPIETQWKINMNFYMGNQFCSIGYGGEIEDYEKQYFWQEREVFNHISPIMEVRLAKLNKLRPKTTVLPASSDDEDIKTAKMSNKILQAASSKINMKNKINEAVKWSEICGTSFYKISWKQYVGQVIAQNEDGTSLRAGDVDVSVCSPFEIYPDSNTCENIESCQSIIHAKAYDATEIEKIYGVKIKGETVNVFGFDNILGLGGLGYSANGTKIIETKRKNSVLVIEKYEKPSVEYPNGRLVIVAGDQLLHDGELPYFNGMDKEREFPFVKQISICQPGSFWGGSIIDRLIPIQRAYNAVKNRKHEFLNRLSMGVLKVEDGSVDIENLEDEGLCPGKILVYRQGATPPSYLTEESLSNSFAEEEDKLLDEFRNISGVSDVTDSRYLSSNLSGIAMQLMVEQDEMRVSAASDNIKACIKEVSRQILKLYKQFANLPRLSRIVGENGDVELFYFNKNDVSCDDVQFESETEAGESITQKRQMMFDLLNAGVFYDKDGKLSNHMKTKFLELLGFGIWENAQDLNDLQMKKADSENIKMSSGVEIHTLSIDDDELHINQHIAYMLSGDYEKHLKNNEKIQEILLNHIEEHKNKLKLRGN